MRLKLPFKNRNQGVYWVRYYLDHVDRPKKEKKPTKQQHYRSVLEEMKSCFDQPSYPQDIDNFLLDIDRTLNLKNITSKHLETVCAKLDILTEKYNKD